jgi:ABC-type sugar transport system permease subunit
MTVSSTGVVTPAARDRTPAPRRGSGSRRPRAQGALPSYGALLLPLLFLGVLAIVPIVQLLRMSVSDVGPQNIIGDWPFTGTANFQAVFASSDFWQAFGRSFVFTVVLLAGVLVIGFIAAVWLTKDTRLSRFVQGLMMLCWALPPIVTGTGWKFLLQGTGPINSAARALGLPQVSWLGDSSLVLWTLIGITMWANIPFAATVLKAGLLGVPADTLEAASLDGAGPFQTIVRVVIPQMRGIIATLAVLVFVYGFGSSFNFIYVVTAGGPGTSSQTLPYFGYVAAFQNFQFGIAGAVAVVSIVVVLIVANGYIRSTGKEAVSR